MRNESSPLISIRSAVSYKTFAMVLLSTSCVRGNCNVQSSASGVRLHSSELALRWRRKKIPAERLGFSGEYHLELLHLDHVGSLRPFLTVDNLEFDYVPFLKALVTDRKSVAEGK